MKQKSCVFSNTGIPVAIIYITLFAMAAIGSPSQVSANAEPPTLYDARSTGMGGTGLTLLENASAGFHNPASLEGIHWFSATAAITPMFATIGAPFAPIGSSEPGKQYKSKPSAAPLFFAGVAGRVHDRIVAGANAFIFSGVGSTYEGIREINPDNESGEDIDIAAGFGEVSFPVSFRILDSLSVGAAFRLGFSVREVDVYNPLPGFQRGRSKQSLTGFGAPGVLVGARYEPTEGFRIGFTYRSKMNNQLSGTTESEVLKDTSLAKLDTKSTWSTPHTFRLGGSYSWCRNRFSVALEAKYQLFKDSNPVESYTVDLPPGAEGLADENQEVPLNWKDSFLIQSGAEYQVVEDFIAVRVGGGLGNSATNEKYATPFMAPAGLSAFVSTGVGAKFEYFDVDFGFAYAFARDQIDKPIHYQDEKGVTTFYVTAGDYSADAYLISGSLSYNL